MVRGLRSCQGAARWTGVAVVAALFGMSGCAWFEAPGAGMDSCAQLEPPAGERPSIPLELDPDRLRDDFFAAPFPSLARNGECRLDAADFPAKTLLLSRLRQLVRERNGYALTAGIFFGLTGPLAAEDVRAANAAHCGSSSDIVAGTAGFPASLLFPLSASSADPDPNPVPQNRHTVERSLVPASAGGSSSDEPRNLLTLLPRQGFPLRPGMLYAALVTDQLARVMPSVGGSICELPRSPLLPACAREAYQRAIDTAKRVYGVDCSRIAGLTVFATDNPLEEFRAATKMARTEAPARWAPDGEMARDVAPGGLRPRCDSAPFCVFSGTLQLPNYQHGTPPYAPYLQWGGRWRDPPGTAITLQNWVNARIVVTLPRKPMPRAGFPAVVMVRAGAGGNGDPLVDRGPIAPPSCWFSNCRGPAEMFASAGFAGITVDGPLVGSSRAAPLLLNEDLAIFDFLNPDALVDNVRQSALELALLPSFLANLRVDIGRAHGTAQSLDCEGLLLPGDAQGQARIDTQHLAIFAHSMGSSIAPLTLAADGAEDDARHYGAAIFSGSGGSFIQNVLYKTLPLPVGAAGGLVGYSGFCPPHAGDPQLSLLQWALEPADSQVYARYVVNDATLDQPARHVLMVQGIIDHYITPPIADAMSLAEGLDLATSRASCSGNPRCDVLPEINGCATGIASPGYPSLQCLMSLDGRTPQPLPLAGNRVGQAGRRITAAVVQHRAVHPQGCACVDGHEVIYESDLARHQYECFLRGFAADALAGPTIPEAGVPFEECP